MRGPWYSRLLERGGERLGKAVVPVHRECLLALLACLGLVALLFVHLTGPRVRPGFAPGGPARLGGVRGKKVDRPLEVFGGRAQATAVLRRRENRALSAD